MSNQCEVITTPIKKSKNAIEVKSDNQILEENDTFWIKRIFKWFLLILVISLITTCTCIYIYKLIKNPVLLSAFTAKITDNLIVIIISALSILGINVAVKQ